MENASLFLHTVTCGTVLHPEVRHCFFLDAFVDVGLDYVSLGCVKLRYDTLRQQGLCWYGLDWFGLG